MKKKLSKAVRILAALAVTLLAVTGTPFCTYAAETVNGEQVSFEKYLVMDQHANVPDVTFTFTVVPGSAVEVDTVNNKPAVKAGIGTPTITTAVFEAPTASAPGTDTYTAVQNGDSVTLASGQKYAKQTVTVDLSGVSFTEPGIYRYLITEEPSLADGISNDPVTARVLDVYVQSDDDGNLSIAGNVLHKTTDIMENAGGSYGDDKDNGFTGSYATNDLTISKTVTGNQGLRSKYFKFTVEISNAAAGTKYDVDLTGATSGNITGVGTTNPSLLFVENGGTVTGTFYLKNGENIVIRGLTAGTEFTVSEENEDYIASWQIDQAAKTAGSSTGMQSMGGESHRVDFTNHREGTVPTGILMDVAPYLVMVMIAGAACILLFGRRRRRR